MISVIIPALMSTEFERDLALFSIAQHKKLAEFPDEVEIVVVETGSSDLIRVADCHIYERSKSCYSRDFNLGVDNANGDYVLQSAIDIIPCKHWDTLLLECFKKKRDCGVATLRANHLNMPEANLIQEGIYGPFSMWRRNDPQVSDRLLDSANFPDIFSDTDLIMRIYIDGYRSYRNWNGFVYHLEQVSYKNLNEEKTRKQNYQEKLDLFKFMYQDSGLDVFVHLANGRVF